MGKHLFLAEKPSVAREFAAVLSESMQRNKGYLESTSYLVTWCVGHLVTMSYPDAYDPELKRWSFDTLPFLPKTYRYELIPAVEEQFLVVKELLLRPDVDTIYVCTDAGREGEYIYRLVAQMAGVPADKKQKRVWIDSQTEEEIQRGIREAKDLSFYDHLSDAAYLRAKEDYLMGINFSRALSIRYAGEIANFQKKDYRAISVGRVMTCVLGMVVRREREIRDFQKLPFYRLLATHILGNESFTGEWRVCPSSRYGKATNLYKENGFRERSDAEALRDILEQIEPREAQVERLERKTQKKNAPLLYNLAELQNDGSRYCKLSPDDTLQLAQELYEKKLITYPRTDARVLSTAIAKQIQKNLQGLKAYPPLADQVETVLEQGSWKTIEKSRYTNDQQVTDHYALIPTGQGLRAWHGLSDQAKQIYDLIARRFLSIFYPPAVYQKIALDTFFSGEKFTANFRVIKEDGYLQVAYHPKETKEGKADGAEEETFLQDALLHQLQRLKKGDQIPIDTLEIKEGETTPPKRYTSGSMILAMENAGQWIEEEELREQIRGSGIGTSATRAEILKKLIHIQYLSLQKKTQVIRPTQTGEMVYDVVDVSIRSLLNPELTASWEKGLSYVAEGQVEVSEYMQKLEAFVEKHTRSVQNIDRRTMLRKQFQQIAMFYQKPIRQRKTTNQQHKNEEKTV